MPSNLSRPFRQIVSFVLICLSASAKADNQDGLAAGMILLTTVPYLLISDWETTSKTRAEKSFELGASISMSDSTRSADLAYHLKSNWHLSTHYVQTEPSLYRSGEMNGDRGELGLKYYGLGILFFEAGIYSSRYRMQGLEFENRYLGVRDYDPVRSSLYESKGLVGRIGLSVALAYFYFHITMASFRALQTEEIQSDFNYQGLPDDMIVREIDSAKSAYEKRNEVMLAAGLLL